MILDNYPKSIKKVLRYIKQEATLAQLESLEIAIIKSINIRKAALRKNNLK